MRQIQQAIEAIILDKFPDCALMPSYAPITQIHYFQITTKLQSPDFSVILPPGFMMTQLHVKSGHLIFEAMVHTQVFLELYGQKLFIQPVPSTVERN